MERIKIPTPPSYDFSTLLTIRITDLNYGGHVGNDTFLSLIHEARQQYLHFHGYTEMNLGGAALIMADVAIEFKRELVYKDELRVSVTATGFDRIGFDIFYLLEVKTEDKWVTAGKAKTGMLCFDYAAKKKVPVPAEVIQKLTVNQ